MKTFLAPNGVFITFPDGQSYNIRTQREREKE